VRTSQPPGAATWLLKHLTPDEKNELLLGDLLEDFVQGRSAAWYWRQVVAAIFVSFAQELRSRWLALGFAAFWAVVASLCLRHIYSLPQIGSMTDSFFGWSAQFNFPVSLICTVTLYTSLFSGPEIVAALVGLGVYLAMVGGFTARRFLRRSLAVTVVVFVGNLVLPFVVRPYKYQFVASIPLFLGLLSSMWVRPHKLVSS
jgi:hypothetical protein